MNRDFKDLLSAFNAQKVEYLVVGAHALASFGHVRATKDLDIWIRPTPENAKNVVRALRSFGAALQDLTEDDLAKPGTVFQIGVAPIRIDVLTSIDGDDFAEAWPTRIQTTFAGEPGAVISREHFIQNKRASGRAQDLADIKRLEADR